MLIQGACTRDQPDVIGAEVDAFEAEPAAMRHACALFDPGRLFMSRCKTESEENKSGGPCLRCHVNDWSRVGWSRVHFAKVIERIARSGRFSTSRVALSATGATDRLMTQRNRSSQSLHRVLQPMAHVAKDHCMLWRIAHAFGTSTRRSKGEKGLGLARASVRRDRWNVNGIEA